MILSLEIWTLPCDNHVMPDYHSWIAPAMQAGLALQPSTWLTTPIIDMEVDRLTQKTALSVRLSVNTWYITIMYHLFPVLSPTLKDILNGNRFIYNISYIIYHVCIISLFPYSPAYQLEFVPGLSPWVLLLGSYCLVVRLNSRPTDWTSSIPAFINFCSKKQ